MNGQEDFRELWQSESPPGTGLNGHAVLAMVQKKTRNFDRLIAARNAMECVAGLALVIFFLYEALHATDALARAGCLIVAASAAWIAWYVVRWGANAPEVDPDQGAAGYAQALLERCSHQIWLLRSVKYWYLLPMYVGLLVLSTASWLRRARTGSLGWRDFSGAALYTALFALIWWLNEIVAVRRLEEQRARILSMTGSGEGRHV